MTSSGAEVPVNKHTFISTSLFLSLSVIHTLWSDNNKFHNIHSTLNSQQGRTNKLNLPRSKNMTQNNEISEEKYCPRSKHWVSNIFLLLDPDLIPHSSLSPKIGRVRALSSDCMGHLKKYCMLESRGMVTTYLTSLIHLNL